MQLYIRDVLASVARPVIELRGFRRVHLAPGERTTVAFKTGGASLFLSRVSMSRYAEMPEIGRRPRFYDMEWLVEPDTFRVLVGSWSKDIRLRGEFAVR